MAGAAISDDALAQEVREFLISVWDLSTVTLNTLRQSLEAKLGCDLEGRKDTISAALREYIESMGDEDEDAVPAAAAAASAGAAGAAGGAEAEADEDDDDDVGLKGGSGKKRKKSGGGMNAVMILAPELADVVGIEEAGRMTVVKKLWEYIRANNLQNPKDKRKIMCDEKFQKIFKAKSVTMFSMNKLLGKKMWKAGEYEARADDDDDEAEEEEDGADDEEDEDPKPRRAAKKPKVENSSEKKAKSKAKPKTKSAEPKAKREQPKQRLSASMSQILGVEKASRFELVKLLWVYIKAKDLQNPSDRREIALDAPLQAAFGVKTLTAFSMNKYLGAHLIKEGAGADEAEAEEDEGEEEAEQASA